MAQQNTRQGEPEPGGREIEKEEKFYSADAIIITCLAFCGGARHELVSVVLSRVAVPAIDALVARVIVVIKFA